MSGNQSVYADAMVADAKQKAYESRQARRAADPTYAARQARRAADPTYDARQARIAANGTMPSVKRPERAFVAPTLQKTAVERMVLDRSGVNKEFDANRARATQTEGAALQGQRDAIARRAAALGNAPGGAMIKAEQQAANESASRLQQANREIDSAKDAELRRIGELETQINVQREEAQAGRDIQKYTTDLGSAIQMYGINLDADFKDIANSLDAWVKGETIGMAKTENTFNQGTALATMASNLKQAGYNDDQIGAILGTIPGGTDLKGIKGATERRPLVPIAGNGALKAINENLKNGWTKEELRAAGYPVA